MKICLSAFLAMVMTGCAKPTPPPPQKPLSAFHFLALGDSYTIGEGVGDSDRWPMQLAASMRAAGIDMGDPTIIAQTGWTTANLAGAIDESNPQGPFDLVALMIGVNNQFQKRPEEEYRQQFAQLLKRSVELAGGKPRHVIVLSIPDWGVTQYARQIGADAGEVAASIDRFNAICKSETVRAGAAFVDVTPISRSHPEMSADDGLHPSPEMYGQWVKLALPAAEAAMGK